MTTGFCGVILIAAAPAFHSAPGAAAGYASKQTSQKRPPTRYQKRSGTLMTNDYLRPGKKGERQDAQTPREQRKRENSATDEHRCRRNECFPHRCLSLFCRCPICGSPFLFPWRPGVLAFEFLWEEPC